MIRNDLKQLYTNNTSNSLWNILPYRPGIDPSGYQTGTVTISGEKPITFAYNSTSGQFMDYFYDDLENSDYVDLAQFGFIKTPGRYGINVQGEVYDYSRNSTVTQHQIQSENYTYSRVSLSGKWWLTHRIIGTVFCPNSDPSSKTMIDHINQQKTDNRKENLRWVTASENSRNYPKPIKSPRVTYFRDIYTNTYKDVKENDTDEQFQINAKTLQYLKDLGLSISDVNWALWKEIYLTSTKYFIHPLGLVMTSKHLIMSFDTRNGYLSITDASGKHHEMNRLVYSAFAGPINPGNVIDHINRNKRDNRIENLQQGSLSDNMNNPLTKQAIRNSSYQKGLKRPIKGPQRNYESIREAAKENGVSPKIIKKWINKIPEKGFSFL